MKRKTAIAITDACLEVAAGSVKMPWELTFDEFSNPMPKPKAGYQLLYHYTKSEGNLSAVERTGLKRKLSGGSIFAHQEYKFVTMTDKPLVVFQAPKDEVRRLSGGGTVVVFYDRDIEPKDILKTFVKAWSRPWRLALGKPDKEFRSDWGAQIPENEAKEIHRSYVEVAVIQGLTVPTRVMRDYKDFDPENPTTSAGQWARDKTK